ncbi:MAG: alpha/beta fold hydrolase [Dehalococcoidia bacterium]|nr:MAG: alpha/beta fold hydrolase [Dehalococcoidia bacterium]
MHLHVYETVALHPRPNSVLLVHGSVSSGPIWQRWQTLLAEGGWSSIALDLRGHGASDPVDLSDVGMDDYLEDVRRVARTLPAPPVVLGWSMGGLLALRFAEVAPSAACIALAPSPPARVRNPDVEIRRGVFDASEYGITSLDPEQQRGMPDLDIEARQLALRSLSLDSRRARDERSAGVPVARIAVPLLLIIGGSDRQFRPATYDQFPFEADRLFVPEASHWGLVLSRQALDFMKGPVVAWLARVTPAA